MEKRLANCEGYGDVFKIVKRSVKDVLGMRRAGLMLVLGNLRPNIGALHFLGSNAIVLNKSFVESLDVIVKTKKEKNYIIYDLLLHEYIHSFGYLDEHTVRSFCWKVCEKTFGKDHLTTKMAYEGPWKVYPKLAWVGPSGNFYPGAKIIKRFDEDSISYIG